LQVCLDNSEVFDERHHNVVWDSKMPLCGISSEDSFHANIECPQAKHLRDAMREHWPLPTEDWFRRTGVDWLLLLLDKCSQEQGDLCLLVFLKQTGGRDSPPNFHYQNST
jgi:hypothetical protein